MKRIDFMIVNSYHGNPLSPEWYETFSKAGVVGVILTPNFYEYEELKRINVEVIYLPDYFPSERKSPEKIISVFNQFGIDDLINFVATEKAYYGEQESYIIPWAYKYLCAFDRLFKEYEVKNVIQWMGGEVLRRTCALQCNHHGVNLIYVGESFLPGQMNLYKDEFKSIYHPKNNSLLTKYELVKIYHNKVVDKKVIKYGVRIHPVYRGNMLKKAVKLTIARNWNIIRAYIFHKQKTGKGYQKGKDYSKQHSILNLGAIKSKFFFFPFNVAAESELYIRNPSYINQVEFVLQLVKHLPAGYLLAVKPHPGNEGYLTNEQMDDLAKNPQIILFHETVNTYDIINASEGVVIVSSTVGLESYLLGKATAVLGKWPYTFMGEFIHDVPLSELFVELLAKTPPSTPVDLLGEINKYTVKGSLFGSEEDFKHLIDSLVNEFK